jgi:hypothetical protein
MFDTDIWKKCQCTVWAGWLRLKIAATGANATGGVTCCHRGSRVVVVR